MKIRDIINEVKLLPKLTGKSKRLPPRITDPMPATFIQKQLRNTDPYMQYRYGIAVAAARAIADGHLTDDDFEQESEYAENLTQVAYSKEEEEIVDLASKLMGVTPIQITSSKSTETSDVNKSSPVSKPKRNKYGV
jgi:hypothetical protein